MQQRDLRSHCIMGTDYYITNEHVIRDDGTPIGAGDVYGYYVITRQYFDRYRLPVMHTETNRTSHIAVEWLWKEWMNLLRLREDGVPIIGFTWFGLLDMKDWDSALTQSARHSEQSRAVYAGPQAAQSGQGISEAGGGILPSADQQLEISDSHRVMIASKCLGRALI